MKIKIIKRAERENALPAAAVSVPINYEKNGDTINATATVKSWIDDLRQKREDERLLFQQLFKEEYCSQELRS